MVRHGRNKRQFSRQEAKHVHCKALGANMYRQRKEDRRTSSGCNDAAGIEKQSGQSGKENGCR